MDRDEAIARGLRVHETQHSMKRRSPWHDYHGRGTYMLTLVVEGRMPLLGKLWGWVDARPGDGDAPKVILSELGHEGIHPVSYRGDLLCHRHLPIQLLHGRTRHRKEPAATSGEQHLHQGRFYLLRANHHHQVV